MLNDMWTLLLLWMFGTGVPQKGDPITVHVREVNRTEDERTEKGTWYHVKATVESEKVVYTLKCDEFINVDIMDYTLRCGSRKAWWAQNWAQRSTGRTEHQRSTATNSLI
jgi:hypothetical protein